MDISTLTSFFMWCTIINGGLMIYSSLIIMLAPDWIYRMQSKWFPLPRETFNAIIYSYLGLFKVLFLLFNVTPYIALLIIG